MAIVRFGIIACSGVAQRRFLPALATSARARLERIGSRDAAKAQTLSRKFSDVKYGSYEDVLTDPEVDAVYISTPPLLHEEWVLKAASAGKHILCEKPALGDYSAAQEAVAVCQARGVRLLEGYTFRHHPQHALVRSLIATGRIGEPRFFQAEFIYPRPAAGDIRLSSELAGGVFHDSAGYAMAAALLHLPGKPTAVFCQLEMDRRAGVDNTFSAWLRFSEGATAQMLVAFDAHYRSRYAVVGTRGRVELERAFSVAPPAITTVVVETEAGEERLVVPPADQFRLMVDDFAAQICAEAPRQNWETDLLRQHAIMDAAARSAREGRLVDLAEYNL